MKRYKYGINANWQNSGKFFEILPIGYVETAPGDTISGKISTKMMSDTLFKPLMNRAYQDIYAFYVPYRLVWEDFPKFVSDSASGLSVPTVANTFPTNFETGPIEHSALRRRAYNLICSKFFTHGPDIEYPPDGNTLHTAWYRPTTLIDRFKTSLQVTDTTIADPTSVDSVRAGFAQDRFKKTREYYGAKYTDFLAALGVEATWSILDEPELIGMKNASIAHKTTYATYSGGDGGPVANETGDPAGTFQLSSGVSLRRTFTPEHGIIAVVAVHRIDLVPNNLAMFPADDKLERSMYYSPEFETERVQEWNNVLNPAAYTEAPFITQKFDDYRVGINMMGRNPGGLDQNYFAYFADGVDQTLAGLQQPSPDQMDKYFVGTMGDPTNVHFSLQAVQRLQRISPIRPAQAISGVS